MLFADSENVPAILRRLAAATAKKVFLQEATIGGPYVETEDEMVSCELTLTFMGKRKDIAHILEKRNGK